MLVEVKHDIGPNLSPAARSNGVEALVLVDEDLRPADSAEQFTRYEELRDANAVLAHSDGQAVGRVRQSAASWADGRFAAEQADPPVDPESAAYDRVRSLISHVRQQGYWTVRGLELDASEALVDACETHSREIAQGRPATEFPGLGDDPERALPVLRYIAPDRRAALLNGMPEPVASLAPGLVPSQAETPSDSTIDIAPGLPSANEKIGFIQRARSIGSRVLEMLKIRRRAETGIGAAAVAAGSETIQQADNQEPAPTQEANTVAEEIDPWTLPGREFTDALGRKLKMLTFFDNDDPRYRGLTQQVVEGRLAEYQNHGLLTDEAQLDDIRGPNVEIMAVVDESGNVVASMRKIHTTGSEMGKMPSYHKFASEHAFSPVGHALLMEHASPSRVVVEIAALWKNDAYGVDVKLEMYKQALWGSIEQNELWFMGIVQAEYAGLRRQYGDGIVRTLGNKVGVKGEGASEAVRLTPVMIEPRTFFRDLAKSVRDTYMLSGRPRSRRERIARCARAMVLGDAMIGAPRIDPATLSLIQEATLCV